MQTQTWDKFDAYVQTHGEQKILIENELDLKSYMYDKELNLAPLEREDFLAENEKVRARRDFSDSRRIRDLVSSVYDAEKWGNHFKKRNWTSDRFSVDRFKMRDANLILKRWNIEQ
jgi:hypothetical protein